MTRSTSELAATRWNARLLGAFGPILILTGLAGLLIPPRLALMSGAVPYDVFHIAFGVLGTALVLARRARGVALFNLLFGVGDLYQAAAGMLGLFPAALFRYRPADHLAHVGLGLLLAAVGAWGLRVLAKAPSPTGAGVERPVAARERPRQ
jgi:hypothetical protein